MSSAAERGRRTSAQTGPVVSRALVVLAAVAISIPTIWTTVASSTVGLVVVVCGSAALVFIAVRTRRAEAVLVAVAAAAVALWAAIFGISLWPVPLLAAVVIATAVARGVDRARAMSWLRRGRLDGTVIVLSALTIIVASLALYGWSRWAEPDGGPYLRALRENSLVVALLGIAAFALVNALGEEAVYRGILQNALAVELGVAAAIVIQALAFGVLHASGFPSGPAGMVLAAIYGAMLGLLRDRSGGLLVPYVVHVAADVTIGLIVLVVL